MLSSSMLRHESLTCKACSEVLQLRLNKQAMKAMNNSDTSTQAKDANS